MKSNATMLPGFGRVLGNWTFLLVLLLLPALGYAQTPRIVISEVYGGGGTSTGVFTNDFVELYNTTGSPVSLAGYSLQYKGATAGGNYTLVPLGVLTVSIPANGFYLVQMGSSGVASAALPTPDARGSGSLGATAGRIALVSNTTALPDGTAANAPGLGIVDFVGYGSTAATSEGSPALGAGNSISLERKARASSTSATMGAGGIDADQGNGYDSDNNSTDLVTRAAPEPQNSASPAEVLLPTVAFYNTKNPGGALDNLTTYSTTPDGSGPSPANFTTAFQTFSISGTGRSIAANWTVSGSGSKAALQPGATFTVPAAATYTGVLDLVGGATLVNLNTAPTIVFGIVDIASTIEFAQATDYTVPLLAAPGYGNLTLRNASKRLDAGTTLVRGTLLVDNVGATSGAVFGGAPGVTSILSLNGNLTLTNTVNFSPNAAADDRISLLATNTVSPQTLNGGATPLSCSS